MAYDDYLRDPKFEYSPVQPQIKSFSSGQSNTSATTWAVGLFILSFVIFFVIGMYSSPMWVVSMAVGIIAHLVSLKGLKDMGGHWAAITVTIITAIPAYLSCMILLLTVFAAFSRAAG